MDKDQEIARLKEHNAKLVRACVIVMTDWWPLVYDTTCRETVKAQGKIVRDAINNE